MFRQIKERLHAFARATSPDAPYTPIADRVARVPRSIEGRQDPYHRLRPSDHRPKHMGTSTAPLVLREAGDPTPTDYNYGAPTQDMPRLFEVPEWLRGVVSDWDMVIRRKLSHFDRRLAADDAAWPRIQDTQVFQRRTRLNGEHWEMVDTGNLFRTGDIAGLTAVIKERARRASDLLADTMNIPVSPVFVGAPEDDE